MSELLDSLKAELEQFGKANDAEHSECSQQWITFKTMVIN